MKKLLPIVILSAFCSSCRTYQPAWDMLSNEEKSILETSFGKIVYKENNGYYTNDIILSNSNHNELTLTLMPTIRTNTDFNPLVEIANIFSLGLFSLTGIPMAKYESNATLNLELTPYSNLSLDSYHGTGSAYTACYYGYSPNNAVKQSVSNAIYSALKKIAIDQSKEENQTQLANKIKQEQEKEAKAIEIKKNDKIKIEKLLQMNRHNSIKETIINGWTTNEKEDRFKTDEEKQKEREDNIKKFTKWVKKTNGMNNLIFLDNLNFDDTEVFQYNPNTEMLYINISEINSWVSERSKSINWDMGTGTNAFGAKVDITGSYKINYRYSFKKLNNKHAEMKISPNKLKNIKDNLKIAVVVKSDGEYDINLDHLEPTFTAPIDMTFLDHDLLGDLQYLFLYDAKNKKILLDLME